jgi:hypothetical protein
MNEKSISPQRTRTQKSNVAVRFRRGFDVGLLKHNLG